MDLKFLDQPAQSPAGRSTNELDLSPYYHKRSNAGLPLNFLDSKPPAPSAANLRAPRLAIRAPRAKYSGAPRRSISPQKSSSRVSNFSNLIKETFLRKESTQSLPTKLAESNLLRKKTFIRKESIQSLPAKIAESNLLPPRFSESSDHDVPPPPPTPTGNSPRLSTNDVAGLATWDADGHDKDLVCRACVCGVESDCVSQ